jgi:DNA-binding NtrC family response regulator
MEATQTSGQAPRPSTGPTGCGPRCPLATGAAVLVRGRRFEDLEREIYLGALRDNDGSRRRAAKALGIARSTFCERIKRLCLLPTERAGGFQR